MSTDMFSWGLSWMDDELIDHGSHPITYYQDGVEVRGPDDGDILATHGSNPHSVDDLGVLIDTDEMDWLISRKLLPAGFVPKRGDWIETQIQDQTFKFEVMGTSGESVARRSDTYGYRWRIHSKRIEVVNANVT